MMSTLVLTSRAVTIRRRQSDERERWIAAYRQTWPMAGRWAASGAVQHSVETQDRVFRMTEQLISRGVLATRTAAFEALIAADRAVPRDASDACVVAAGARIQAAHESPVPGAGFAPPEWRRASGRPVRETSEARLRADRLRRPRPRRLCLGHLRDGAAARNPQGLRACQRRNRTRPAPLRHRRHSGTAEKA